MPSDSDKAGAIPPLTINSDLPPPTSDELQTVLQRVVDDVVSGLNCVGAMVATLEMDNSLPVRAYSVNIAPNLLAHLEDLLIDLIYKTKEEAFIRELKICLGSMTLFFYKEDLGGRGLYEQQEA